jgi:hypothetical protein
MGVRRGATPSSDVAGREASSEVVHPRWCDGDVAAEFDGVEHASRAHEWHPAYEHEVAIVDLLRQVVYLDGGTEIPTGTVRIDNSSQPGEVALTAEDLATFAGRLLSLRAALIAQRGDSPR